jgi:hypothetical protein
MRLWSLHPKYLDAKGLVALWREALLAQAVLRGNTRGYQNHPQLLRFRQQSSPLSAIASYLVSVCELSALWSHFVSGVMAPVNVRRNGATLFPA